MARTRRGKNSALGTVMQAAVARGDLPEVEARLRRGEMATLHFAPTLYVIRALLENGADPNAWDADGLAPIHFARRMSADGVKLLIGAGADVNARTPAGATPLHMVDDPEVVRILIDAGADVNARTLEGTTPLHVATDPHVVRLLIRAGASFH